MPNIDLNVNLATHYSIENNRKLIFPGKHRLKKMTSIRRTVLPLILFLISLQKSNGIEFCDVKTFDSIFNLGHLIYFLRCGEMWTHDPRLDDVGGRPGLRNESQRHRKSDIPTIGL